MRPSPIAREEMDRDEQPNVSDAAVFLFCVCMAFFMAGYGFAKWHMRTFPQHHAEERK